MYKYTCIHTHIHIYINRRRLSVMLDEYVHIVKDNNV